jgi:hypothetical protein
MPNNIDNNDVMPNCRQCPTNQFEMMTVKASCFMAICHAKECILDPKFPDNKPSESIRISKANVRTVVFEPLDNCPHVESLRNEGILPWAFSIDFSK